MDAQVCKVGEDVRGDDQYRGLPVQNDNPMNHEELDFVEPPSEEFLCPVTAEFLLNPHQTICCGHHLSEKGVNRLERDGKPCPMCKEGKLVTMPDKFFKRMTSAVLVRCPHKASGCEWVGKVGGLKQHIEACPKRAWKCQHCDFESTFEVVIQHEDECTKYPVPCPNKCEVRLVSQASPSSETQICMIPRCDIEKHRAECPLEVVACEFAEIGCKVKTTRQDLKRHMEENQQEHLFSATLLNLRLTKETIAEKDQQLAEKDHQIAKMNQQLNQKKVLLAEKCNQLDRLKKELDEKNLLLAEKMVKITTLEQQLAKKNRHLCEKDNQLAEKDHQLVTKDKTIAMRDSQMLEALVQFQRGVFEFTGGILGFICHRIILERFSAYQRTGAYGDWFSEPFNLDSEDDQLQLNVETREDVNQMNIRLFSKSEQSEEKIFVLALQLLNQQSNHSHFLRQYEVVICVGKLYSDQRYYIPFKDLHKRDGNIQYLKDDCLKFVLWIKEIK